MSENRGYQLLNMKKELKNEGFTKRFKKTNKGSETNSELFKKYILNLYVLAVLFFVNKLFCFCWWFHAPKSLK